MGDLTCVMAENHGLPPRPCTSAFGGVYRCKECTAKYIAEGGPIYSEPQLATFARIEAEYQARAARGEVPEGFRRT